MHLTFVDFILIGQPEENEGEGKSKLINEVLELQNTLDGKSAIGLFHKWELLDGNKVFNTILRVKFRIWII